jgi:hypothetical protein
MILIPMSFPGLLCANVKQPFCGNRRGFAVLVAVRMAKPDNAHQHVIGDGFADPDVHRFRLWRRLCGLLHFDVAWDTDCFPTLVGNESIPAVLAVLDWHFAPNKKPDLFAPSAGPSEQKREGSNGHKAQTNPVHVCTASSCRTVFLPRSAAQRNFTTSSTSTTTKTPAR